MEIVPFTGSSATIGSEVQLFSLPKTDMSIKERRFQDFSPLSDNLTPLEFLIPATDTFIDLNQSYFSMTVRLKKSDGSNIADGENIFPTINFPHTLIKQCSVKWNGVLLNPQTDTYSIRAYFGTILNYTPLEGETLLAPEGWWRAEPSTNYVPLEAPAVLAANLLDNPDNAAYKALPDEQKAFVLSSKTEQVKFQGAKWNTFFFRPMHEVFYSGRLLPPGVEQRMEFHFQPAKYYLNAVGLAGKELHKDDFSMKFHMCIVMVNPTLYKQITAARHNQRQNVKTANVRSECRIFTLASNVQEFNQDNLFQGRIPNRMVVGLLHPNAFNGNYTYHPFAFQSFGMQEIKQMIRGEEYPYRTLELKKDNNEKDMAIYHRFLEAGGFKKRVESCMVTPGMVGHDRNTTLYVFNNTANSHVDGPHLNPKQRGNVRLIFKLGDPVNHPITVVIYAQFEAVIRVDPNGAVLYDIYD